MRNNGSAALALAYIACGRFDAYVESVISIWDVAAGVLLVEAAGGKVVLEPKEDNPEQFAIAAWNGRIPIMRRWENNLNIIAAVPYEKHDRFDRDRV